LESPTSPAYRAQDLAETEAEEETQVAEGTVETGETAVWSNSSIPQAWTRPSSPTCSRKEKVASQGPREHTARVENRGQRESTRRRVYPLYSPRTDLTVTLASKIMNEEAFHWMVRMAWTGTTSTIRLQISRGCRGSGFKLRAPQAMLPHLGRRSQPFIPYFISHELPEEGGAS
jgi:hypothetical protein